MNKRAFDPGKRKRKQERVIVSYVHPEKKIIGAVLGGHPSQKAELQTRCYEMLERRYGPEEAREFELHESRH